MNNQSCVWFLLLAVLVFGAYSHAEKTQDTNTHDNQCSVGIRILYWTKETLAKATIAHLMERVFNSTYKEKLQGRTLVVVLSPPTVPMKPIYDDGSLSNDIEFKPKPLELWKMGSGYIKPTSNSNAAGNNIKILHN